MSPTETMFMGDDPKTIVHCSMEHRAVGPNRILLTGSCRYLNIYCYLKFKNAMDSFPGGPNTLPISSHAISGVERKPSIFSWGALNIFS